jgi:hypothetical protein
MVQGTAESPFPWGDGPPLGERMSAGEELRPHREAEALTQVDPDGRRDRWGNLHGLHQSTLRSLQSLPFPPQCQLLHLRAEMREAVTRGRRQPRISRRVFRGARL